MRIFLTYQIVSRFSLAGYDWYLVYQYGVSAEEGWTPSLARI